MKANIKKKAVKPTAMSKFPLRLMPSVRKRAEDFSDADGVSLNQFINVAVAEKVVQLEHERWVEARKNTTPISRAEALAILDRAGKNPPEEWDKLPEGYVSTRKKVKG
jgi:hypothetical protein